MFEDRAVDVEGLVFLGVVPDAQAVPGEPDKSRIIEAVRYKNEDLQMPPKSKGKLADAEIETLEKWVKMGAPWPNAGKTSNRRAPGSSRSLVHCHARSEMVPAWPVVDRARARLKFAEPKSASGSVWHSLAFTHTDGASAIHSADDTSRLGARRVLWKERPLVLS